MHTLLEITFSLPYFVDTVSENAECNILSPQENDEFIIKFITKGIHNLSATSPFPKTQNSGKIERPANTTEMPGMRGTRAQIKDTAP